MVGAEEAGERPWHAGGAPGWRAQSAARAPAYWLTGPRAIYGRRLRTELNDRLYLGLTQRPLRYVPHSPLPLRVKPSADSSNSMTPGSMPGMPN